MLNRVTLIGRLGQDVEMRYTPSGTACANFSIATTDKYKDREGVWKEETEWHRIVAWAKLAETCGTYLKKGKLVYIEGKIKTRKWEDKNQITRYTTEIIAREMKMLGGKEPASSNNSQSDQQDELPF